MDAAPTLPTRSLRQRKKQSPHAKLDYVKAAQFADAGLGCVDIAKHQGVSKQAAWQFLHTYQLRKPDVAKFRAIRADVLAELQADNLNLQAKLLQQLNQDGVLDSLTQHAKTGLLFALNAQHGTLFDKERLERGESTSNHSVMTTMLGNSVKSLYAKTPRAKPPRAPRALRPRPSRTHTTTPDAERG